MWNNCRIIWFYLGTIGIIFRGYYELFIVKRNWQPWMIFILFQKKVQSIWVINWPGRYTHKMSGFKTSGSKTSGFKTSETSGLQNIRYTKCQVYKTSGLQNVRLKKTSLYILYLWLVEIRRFCCSHVCSQSDGCVLFSILEVILPYITMISNNDTLFTLNRNANLALPILFVSNLKN